MDSVYFWFLHFLVKGWCYPVHYESTEATEMDYLPVTLEDSMNDPWNFDDYTSEGRYKEHHFSTNATIYPPLFTLFSTSQEETQMITQMATRTTTEIIPTRITLETVGQVATSTIPTPAVKVASTVLNETTTTLGDLHLLTEDREGMIVLRKVAQIMVLLGDRVIPHIIEQLSGFDNKCKDTGE